MLVPLLRALARVTPLSWLHCAGAVLGRAVYLLSPVYALRMRENIRASGVCSAAQPSQALVRAAATEAGKSVAELLTVWFDAPDRVAALVRDCRGWDSVEHARQRGRGIIFLTPHLGCFEITALYAARRMPITVLYRPPRKRWLGHLLAAGRSRSGTLAPATLSGVRTLYRALARGEAIGMLPDQAPGVGEGVWAPFFGRPAYTMTLVARLRESTGAALIMAFAERLPAGRGYCIHLEEIAADSGFDEAALNRAIESVVRRCPAQYLWSYNRYKVPAGAPPPPAAPAC